MNSSQPHRNWVTVGETLNLIKKLVASYADHTVNKWHAKLCQDCRKFGRCTNPANCITKTHHGGLCHSCKGWYDKLALSHKNPKKSQIKWRQNCDTSKWPDDPWEVAKFFMSTLGDNKSRLRDADSTDLSFLLNLLEWMEDVAFCGDRRVDLDLLKQLRSEVRNAWAHAPNQEMKDAELDKAFDTVKKFLADLDQVFNCKEVEKCIGDIEFLQANKLTNVVEAHLKNLLLLRKELQVDVGQMKEEIKTLRQDQTINEQAIQQHERKLTNLEVFTQDCCARVDEFHKWKEQLDRLFNDVKLEMENIRQETKKDITEIREDVEKLQEAINVQKTKPSQLKSFLPDRLSSFVGREEDVKKIMRFLEEKGCGIISIIGGPGVGKSTIATEVSHRISNKHDIPIIFSHLSNASTVSEVVLRLCRDIGVSLEEDPELSLLSWLRKIGKKVVVVMDNIEQLLEGRTHSKFIGLLLSMRKACTSLQIITTSRKALAVRELKVQTVRLLEMDGERSVQLVKFLCSELQLDDGNVVNLASLCGHVPLALCIAASLLKDIGDINKTIKWLKEKPMEALQSSETKVRNAIETSFNRLKEEDKSAFARLSVFDGNFDEEAAQAITGLEEIATHQFLKNLFDRCLIQRSGDRFSLHLLIKIFLLESANFHTEKDRANEAMVNYFLSLCQSLTLKYWSKDGFLDARSLLVANVHNIEKSLKLCQEAIKDNAKDASKNIVSSLEKSTIYQSSCRFFYHFVEYIVPQPLIKGFLESCTELAERSGECALKVNYNCLMAHAITRESGQPFTPESSDLLEKTKEIVDQRKEELERHSESILAYFYHSYGRYLHKDFKTLSEAGQFLRKALEIRKLVTEKLEKVDKVLTLIQLGRCEKQRSRGQSKTIIEIYERAIEFAEEVLGNHSTTATCYKLLGDLYFKLKDATKALKYFDQATKIYKLFHQQGNFSPSFFFLIKNRGLCMHDLGRHEDAVRICVEALALAENLVNGRCKAQAHFSLATVLNVWTHAEERLEHARQALELKKHLWKTDYEYRNMCKMDNIIRGSKTELY